MWGSERSLETRVEESVQLLGSMLRQSCRCAATCSTEQRIPGFTPIYTPDRTHNVAKHQHGSRPFWQSRPVAQPGGMALLEPVTAQRPTCGAAAHNSTAHAPTLISPHPACRCQYSPASILLLESSAIFAFSIMHFPSLYFWLSSNASSCDSQGDMWFGVRRKVDAELR